jgi:hypothetical protein
VWVPEPGSAAPSPFWNTVETVIRPVVSGFCASNAVACRVLVIERVSSLYFTSLAPPRRFSVTFSVDWTLAMITRSPLSPPSMRFQVAVACTGSVPGVTMPSSRYSRKLRFSGTAVVRSAICTLDTTRPSAGTASDALGALNLISTPAP